MQAAMTSISPQPDVRLELDLDGVIQSATLSAAVPSQDLEDWIGRPWLDTVVDPGSTKVHRIVADARTTGVSAFRQINQRFPSGLELPIEYIAVRQGRKRLVVVGKSLQAVAELQSRLNAAQHAIEQDYWKLRDIETRCRLLFDRSNEAVLLVQATSLRIVEANPAAVRALGASGAVSDFGQHLLSEVAGDDFAELSGMLDRVRDDGRAPGILVHLGPEKQPWLVRASLLPSQDGLTYLLQLSPTAGVTEQDPDRISLDELIEHSPDGFVAIDRRGIVRHANRAFLSLVQVANERAVVGERLDRWLGQPGADTATLLSSVQRLGSVRLFSTRLHGDLGATTEVEVASSGDGRPDSPYLGLVIRDVESRLPAPEIATNGSALGRPAERVGKNSLPELVKEAVGVVERHYITAALESTDGNRTAAAQLLGLSRQSLYAKLNRYGLEENEPGAKGPIVA